MVDIEDDALPNVETHIRWRYGVFCVTQKPYEGLALAGFDLKHRAMAGRRTWTEEDIAKLKSLAGRRPPKDIAVALGRSVEATVVAASKLKLSLRTRFDFARTAYGREPKPF
jgi:hypothetical protein